MPDLTVQWVSKYGLWYAPRLSPFFSIDFSLLTGMSLAELTLQRAVQGLWGNSLSKRASEPGMMVPVCNCRTRAAEAGGLGVQGQPVLCGKIQDSPGYLRSCQNKTNKTGNHFQQRLFHRLNHQVPCVSPTPPSFELGLWVGLLPVT